MPELIPVFDLKSEINIIYDEVLESIQEVLKSGQFIMGEQVAAFEKEVADYLGVRHAIGVNSGTDALIIGLRSVGIGKGDEVITTPFTFFATVEAIHQIGAVPKFVDIENCTFNIDSRKIEEAITSKTKAILPVHLFGHAAEMRTIMDLAKAYDLKVVEDTAQAFGGEYHGQKLGTIGDVGCFSFFPTKNLGAYGDGGLIVTNDDNVAEIARKLRVHGGKNKYNNEMFGYNSRLDEIQAAILRIKLRYVQSWNEKRRKVAKIYSERLKEISNLVLPMEKGGIKHVYHQYTVRIVNGNRDNIYEQLLARHVQTMIYYPLPVHHLPVYRAQNIDLNLPVAESISKQVLSLPIWPHIEDKQVEYVCNTLQSLLS
ncbi:DegT/DnrJ/EryC1/StrS family aminotransferase [Parageobacillus thermoglucosidasius]|uniref:DegT/DnrJ/EryC1/StrS family aminotransferase n=1 Tax=Parageobacillus thermoglucosidasius TaxID=1426 RepID=UPI00025B4ECF|nr:DegT/DnrJ/EryC1/StrS family aminotransferase [Parageobacillus thermoglucosidasius]EID42448.1 3-amino-5-hydroxybenzoic acid synthase family protein, pyridoxal phosphate (PLP)-dependent aspartate aminotransferase superfamily [Parageobacillus thermoglucosidasius TNO-09.020]KYD12508.1 hypothetical protein B4168_3411 [Anoxybacillus flavithermus]OAO84594.1 UDP-4-amino-4-deoxy-L-arabinose--oxoglutarate aminotransferase [Parageobacillus thermoglucosidasius]BDG30668.1 aminotransferase [Parageobacillu